MNLVDAINLNYTILILTLPNSVHSNMFYNLHAAITETKTFKNTMQTKKHSLAFLILARNNRYDQLLQTTV